MVLKSAFINLIFASISAATPAPTTTAFQSLTDIQLTVPFVHQNNDLNEENIVFGYTTCGPAALTMVLKHSGMSIGINEVLDRIPNYVYIKGDQFYDLPEGTKYFNKKYEYIDNSPKSIYKSLKNGSPLVMNIQNYDGLHGHAIVVTGIRGYDEATNTAKALVVHDPFKGAYVTFEYHDNFNLKQPEGFINPIGIMDSFFIVNSTNSLIAQSL